MLKLARRLARSELRNVRLVCDTAEAIVGDRLTEGSVHAFWINFPDPWPKKRHHRRRLIQPAFVRQLAGRLEPGGLLHAATDHEGYAEAIAEVLAAEPLLENVHAPAAWSSEPPPRAARPPTSSNGGRRAAIVATSAYRRRGAPPSLDTPAGGP